MKMTVSQVIVRFLRDAGVRYIFGVSGHSIFDLTDAIYVEPDIDFVPAQIELAAAYMANGYSRATGQLGVCLASAGAGPRTWLPAWPRPTRSRARSSRFR